MEIGKRWGFAVRIAEVFEGFGGEEDDDPTLVNESAD